MLSRNRLIQRLRSACSQRRLFTGERGAIAASLIEIGVAMLAVGILTAGAVTTFTGFIDSASDTTARGRLNDAASTADQVYNWLRPGGVRCYDDTVCTVSDATAVNSLQEAAGGQLTFDAWNPSFGTANTIYVQVTESYGQENNASTTTNHNGIAGNPADGQWIRLAVRSDSGATFCVVKVAQTADPLYEGVGYMSVNSDDSAASNTSANCGGHNGGTAAAVLGKVTAASCVYGSGGPSTTITGHTDSGDRIITNAVPAAGACTTDRALGRPGAGTDIQ